MIGNSMKRREQLYETLGEKRLIAIVCLYPNDCAAIPKQLCAFAQIEMPLGSMMPQNREDTRNLLQLR